MKIVINHLTRMAPGYICVAGVEPTTGKHIRPVTRGRLSRKLLAEEGGAFAVGRVIDLGSTSYVGRSPETEDYLFDPSKVEIIEKLDAEKFWNVISTAAQASLGEIFGEDLQRQDHGFAVQEHKGNVSLGCLRITQPPNLITTDFFGKSNVRMRMVDHGLEVDLSVTDIRVYEKDQVSPRFSEIERIAQLLRDAEEAILCVGLARSWK